MILRFSVERFKVLEDHYNASGTLAGHLSGCDPDPPLVC